VSGVNSRLRRKFLLPAVAILCLLAASYGFSQEQGISAYYTQPQFETLIDYAVNSGQMQFRHYLTQPFLAHELITSFHKITAPELKRWVKPVLLDAERFCRADSVDPQTGSWFVGMNGSFQPGLRSSQANTIYRAEVYGIYSLPNIVLVNRTVMDRNFKNDPDYYGDTSEWIYGRVQDAYAIFQYRAVRLFAGRLSRNFGSLREPSLILSKNPYSYDHYGFQISSKRLIFSFYMTRLDDIDGYDSQAHIRSVQQSKRYFSVQRADFYFKEWLQVAVTEAVVYGGPNQNVEPAYINPLNLFYIAQRNQLVQMNGLWALDVFFKPARRISLYHQLLIDDLIINNHTRQNDRAQHPDRLGMTLKLVAADYGMPGWQMSLAYTRIGNWTYMSYRTWENYIYHNKGMGYPENSVESLDVSFDFFKMSPLYATLTLGTRRHGQQDLVQVFGDSRIKFPMGVVETSRHLDVFFDYLPSHLYHVSLGCGFENIRNSLHRPDKDENIFYGFIALTISPGVHFQF
jgi:hypothetical protein